MAELTETLARLQGTGVWTAMVYLQEAHADDLWPLGYGIQSHRSVEDRLSACRAFLSRHKDLKEGLQAVAVDTMDDHFLHTYGAWPERYYMIDVISGQVVWASNIGDQNQVQVSVGHNSPKSHVFQEVLAFVGCDI